MFCWDKLLRYMPRCFVEMIGVDGFPRCCCCVGWPRGFAKMFRWNDLPRCFPEIICWNDSPKWFAEMICRDGSFARCFAENTPSRWFTKIFCGDDSRRWFAKMFILRWFVEMIHPGDLLIWLAERICWDGLQDVLPRWFIEMVVIWFTEIILQDDSRCEMNYKIIHDNN